MDDEVTPGAEPEVPVELQLETELAMLHGMLRQTQGDMAVSFTLPNRWGVSIIRTQPTIVSIPGYEPQPAGGSYGASAGLFEVALMADGEVTFDGPILHEPEGWLDPAGVVRKVLEIYDLPEAP